MITSAQNAHFKQLRALNKKRIRDETGLFLVEGEAQIAKCSSVITLYYTELTPFIEGHSAEKVQLSEALFARIAYRERGVMAIAKQNHHTLQELSNAKTLLILEGVEKPGNVGAILRTSKAAGVDGIILCDSPVDLFHPNVIRSSLGCALSQTIVATSSQKALAFLQEHKIAPIVTTPHTNTSCFEPIYKKPFAIVVGSEAKGVGDIWLTEDALKVRIPMHEGIDSLNVSVSAAIILYCAQHGFSR